MEARKKAPPPQTTSAEIEPPRFSFEDGDYSVVELGPIFQATGMTIEEFAVWLDVPNADLQYETPFQAITGGAMDDVLSVAKSTAENFAWEI
jgi:hypothetical protein